MRQAQRRIYDTSMPSLVLPDGWPGDPIRGAQSRSVRDGSAEILMPNWIKPDWASWKRVTVVGRDTWSVSGLRHILARSGAIRLTLLKDIPAQCDPALTQADLVVWLRMFGDGLPELSGHITVLRRRYPQVRQLVLSDALPRTMPPGFSALTGVLAVQASASTEDIYELICRALKLPPVTGPLLSKVLNRSQWRILLLRAAGKSIMEIVAICGISYKTVNTHEAAIKKRMHISNRVEYAWLLRSVQQMQQAVPGLTRRKLK